MTVTVSAIVAALQPTHHNPHQLYFPFVCVCVLLLLSLFINILFLFSEFVFPFYFSPSRVNYKVGTAGMSALCHWNIF
jgi:hypothetical protein